MTTPGWNSDSSFLSSASQSGICRTIKRGPKIQLSLWIIIIFIIIIIERFDCHCESWLLVIIIHHHRAELWVKIKKTHANILFMCLRGLALANSSLPSFNFKYNNCWLLMEYLCLAIDTLSVQWMNHYLYSGRCHNVGIKEAWRHVNKQRLLATSQITFVIHSNNTIWAIS